jgi:purine-nucleoside phosphorylase
VGPEKVTALVRAAAVAGARTAVLCNANGCLRDWSLGDVMAIEDHANFSGVSPFNGTVFLDTSTCWDPALTERLASVCERRGTYAILRGPEYQTPLETRLLAAAGVDCVGMSTVMEALTLHALGVHVCGMSVVTDLSFASAPTDPTAVVETGRRAQKRVFEGIQAIFRA